MGVELTRLVFFICFRESLESAIIVSVLLSFLKGSLHAEHDEAMYKRLVKQVSICSEALQWP
jgi:high-affinity iron transporter